MSDPLSASPSASFSAPCFLTVLRRGALVIAAALAVNLAPGGAPAMAQAPRPANIVSAEILPGWRGADGVRMAALHLRLADGWKTYWRAPGDAGIPPTFDWSGSDNVASVAPHWPAPSVFHLNGLRTVGYSHDLILPLEITPADPSRPVSLNARIDLGVCRDVCVPVTLRVSGAPTNAGEGAHDPRIVAALADVPQPGSGAGLRALRCRVDPLPDGLRLTAEMELPSQGGEETAVIESGDPAVWVSEARLTRKGVRLHASADLVNSTGQPFALNRSALRLTVLGTAGAVDIHGCPSG